MGFVSGRVVNAVGNAACEAIVKEVSGAFATDKEGNPYTGMSRVLKIAMFDIALAGMLFSAAALILELLPGMGMSSGEAPDSELIALLGCIFVFLLLYYFLMKMWMDNRYTLKGGSLYIKRFARADLEISYEELARYGAQWPPVFLPGNLLLVSESGLIKIPFGNLKGGCKFCGALCRCLGLDDYTEEVFVKRAAGPASDQKEIKARREFCKTIRKK